MMPGRSTPESCNAFAFDQMQNGYYAIGEKVGQAWNSGAGSDEEVKEKTKYCANRNGFSVPDRGTGRPYCFSCNNSNKC